MSAEIDAESRAALVMAHMYAQQALEQAQMMAPKELVEQSMQLAQAYALIAIAEALGRD